MGLCFHDGLSLKLEPLQARKVLLVATVAIDATCGSAFSAVAEELTAVIRIRLVQQSRFLDKLVNRSEY
jgi:hypothetical protein